MTEMTSVGIDASIKVCKVCSPEAETPCRLSDSVCPYRDMDFRSK